MNRRSPYFLGTVELLAEFDPFLSEHLKLYAHYIQKISSEVQSAKYLGIIADSTPDIYMSITLLQLSDM